MKVLRDAAKAVLPTASLHRARALRRRYEKLGSFSEWRRRGYASPSPEKIKRAVLARHGIEGATWIETGTYHGDTTGFLGSRFPKVYSIEPEPTLFAMASSRFSGKAGITILNGTSEEVLPGLMPKIEGDVCFWLDGHFSSGGTYLGEKVSPAMEELTTIAGHLGRLGKLSILIDDFRLFLPENNEAGEYPSADYLVDWAREHGFRWSVEQDIFIMKRP